MWSLIQQIKDSATISVSSQIKDYKNSCTNSILNYDLIWQFKPDTKSIIPMVFRSFFTEHQITARGTMVFGGTCFGKMPCYIECQRCSQLAGTLSESEHRHFTHLTLLCSCFRIQTEYLTGLEIQCALFVNVVVVLCHTVFCKHVINEGFSAVQCRDAIVSE